MAGGQERVLRRRIRSVQSTMKITRAFELIAASRIVRAQHAIAATRPYVARLGEVVSHVADSPDASRHPLFSSPETGDTTAVIVIAADRGLCGAYNSSVLRAAERLIKERESAGHQIALMTSGRKAQSYFRYRNRPITESVTGVSDRPSIDDARKIVAAVTELFDAGRLESIQLIYTRFRSIASQEVRTRQLVPLDLASATGGGDPPGTGPGASAEDGHGPGGGFKTDYEFEPDPTEILNRLLPSWLEAEILAAMLDGAASELASRQRAMKAATDNANELIKVLRQVMNRARQDSITTEITEIVGGAESMRAGSAAASGTQYNDTFEPPAA
jgi:F-type H+-transporting ATPase subunit gamma